MPTKLPPNLAEFKQVVLEMQKCHFSEETAAVQDVAISFKLGNDDTVVIDSDSQYAGLLGKLSNSTLKF